MTHREAAGPIRDRRRIGLVVAAALALVAVVVAVGLTRGNGQHSDRAPVGEQQRYYEGLIDAALPPARRTERAAELRAHDEALFALARAHGVVGAAPSFWDLLQRRDEVNRERAEAAAGGRVVYGKLDHDQREFHSRSVTALRTGLLRALTSGSDPELRVSATEVDDYLDRHRSQWSAKASRITLDRIRVPGPGAGGPDLDALTAGLAARPATSALQRRYPGARSTTGTLRPDELARLTLSPTTRAELQTLQPGQYTSPVTDRGGWSAFRLVRVSVDRAEARQIYGPKIRTVLLEQRLDDLIDRTAARSS